MIPQNVKDILSNGENVGFYQTLAMLLFLFFFLGIVYYVFSRPKKHYDEEANAPLDDDIEDKNL
ncbi:MAG TPA: CcoQ/FixQ family Cbb3-type cytochrome c oxidase assembly chaperone [Chryseobacterium sp.]|jgi:cytochrome c oxidase cbb3-type subunit 4|uniref:cbb3-type cytochrome oxidase subunit 3 n=1 Tax=Chryseobacterium group TaxID=2782232 RepID=UPI000B4C80A5|nr:MULTISPECIES: CcoQ/FixQ family Cbb3-type cytochrome c oxidase assembly chaperone [Chryseobacterium]MBH1958602.1 CcoQ/FixQ family Cbb3-type cytochrome c oxidase assembly chaperone [Flavobacteriia bacterium]MBH2024155.1 CcoQ/FixQ family Cbb3-type cytochrome c oxidase assembly chaperone [Flavobacteriales bacterium]MBP3839377.1 CcoQ/FixQ family Cbb3-type cytochrome c oxidase assembly chaperone [Chryseobacterium sp.]MBV2166116.1 cbb3-type cytochrome c oxidase subunit 3 [Kaistella sp.]MCP2037450.